MRLTVIIPIYNEASTLGALLARVRGVPVEKEIIVVDDGSDDGTKDELRQAAVEDIQLLTHPQNQGKGSAIRTALSVASGDVVIIQDADLEYYPEDYVNLIQVYEENDARAVYGVRDLSHRTRLMRWGNQAMTLSTNILYGYRLKDMETCYKMIDRRLLHSLDLQSHRFEIEAEITSKLLRSGVEILETPIRYDPREEGKKLTPMDGLPTLGKLISCRLWKPSSESPVS
ncbi:MAG: glycosyltransferase family 2 protein [Candidatus Promineifilaceae bacterium]